MFSLEVYKETAPREIVMPTLRDDGKNKGDFFGVETLCSKKFAQNYGGYPRSDIAVINEQQNIMVAKQMLENLPDFRTSQNFNANKTDIEVLKGVQSKYMQSPSEFLPYIEQQVQKRIDKAAAVAAYKAEQEATQKSFEQNEKDAVDNA